MQVTGTLLNLSIVPAIAVIVSGPIVRRSAGERRWFRSAAAYFETHRPDWCTFEELPAYAPEMNPVEQCGNHTKYAERANVIPDDVDHLQQAVKAFITEQSEDQGLLKSFFAFAKLPL